MDAMNLSSASLQQYLHLPSRPQSSPRPFLHLPLSPKSRADESLRTALRNGSPHQGRHPKVSVVYAAFLLLDSLYAEALSRLSIALFCSIKNSRCSLTEQPLTQF